jgi:hypothetical protein
VWQLLSVEVEVAGTFEFGYSSLLSAVSPWAALGISGL